MSKPRRIGVMGGSFNPVHIGHLMVADFVRQTAALDEVLMMLSPQNPLKVEKTDLANDTDRMAMLEIACADCHGLTPCDMELAMPRPSYTIDTLERLSRENPDAKYKLIIGSDNWLLFTRWRASQEIIDRFGVIVYPRPGYPVEGPMPKGVTMIDAPTVDLSGTFIREAMARGIDMNIFLPHGVYNYIKEHNVYQR